MMTLREFAADNKVLVAAHRGSSGTAPENTMAALREAVEAGAHIVEVDIQLSSDEQVIVFHDEVLERTTNSEGKVGTRSYTELRRVDAGAWFDARFRGEHIPLLSEALDFLGGKVNVNIEIKPPRAGEDFTRRVGLVAQMISERGLQNNTLYSSFHHESLLRLKQEFEGMNTAAIHLPGDERLPSEVVRAANADAYVCGLREVHPAAADDIREHGIFCGAYTINTPDQLRKAMGLPIKAIVTNFPARIAELLTREYPDRI